MPYTPLDHSQNLIRLLHLAPASSKGDAIKCRFTVSSLDANPDFEALSYVWGSISDGFTIDLNGHPISITRNLHAALEHLRLPDQERTLWVDALCINQLDLEERKQQVSKMTSIYGQASQVVVWLGEGWKGSDSAMEFLRTLGSNEALHLDPSQRPSINVDGESLDSISLCRNIVRLFQLPWWSRTWTVQEFVLAKDLIFQCSYTKIMRHDMYMARENFWNHKDRCCQQNQLNQKISDLGMSMARAFEVPARLDFITKSRNDSYNVLSPMSSFCKHGVTEPHDRIYGMLGLGTGPYANLISADYTLEPEEVCTALAMKLVERSGKLDFLSHLYPHANTKLPSFIPNWTGAFEWDDTNRLWLGNIKFFNASLGSPAEITLISNNTLRVKGLILDTLVATTPASILDALKDDTYFPELSKIAELQEEGSAEKPYRHTEDIRLVAFWHTLSGGMEMVLRDNNRFGQRLKGLTNFSKFEKFLDFFAAEPSERAKLWDNQLNHTFLDLQTATQGRNFFRTREGYFGLGSRRCKEGDCVAVLLGGDVPYVVHPVLGEDGSRKTFNILGDAYVHGTMDGEALDAYGPEMEEIVLV